MDHKKHLFESLQNVVNGKSDYNQFEDSFYTYYITNVRDEDLSDKDHEFFTEIQEKFEYTAPEPPEEDREHGYINFQEFKAWLKDKMKDLPN